MKRIKLFEEFENDSRMQYSRIGVYHDLGVTDGTFQVWQELLKNFFSINAIDINTDTLYEETLNNLDLLIIPGGDSFQERLGMSEHNISCLMNWSANGGKILAVCAGFHLIANGHDWSLNMIDVKSSNTDIPSPGYQPIHRVTDDVTSLNFEITEIGQMIFDTDRSDAVLYYHGGPICELMSDDIDILLKFKQPIPMQVPGDDFTQGKIAGVRSLYKNGEIIAISPHIEKTEKYKGFLANAIKFLVLQHS